MLPQRPLIASPLRDLQMRCPPLFLGNVQQSFESAVVLVKSREEGFEQMLFGKK